MTSTRHFASGSLPLIFDGVAFAAMLPLLLHTLDPLSPTSEMSVQTYHTDRSVCANRQESLLAGAALGESGAARPVTPDHPSGMRCSAVRSSATVAFAVAPKVNRERRRV